MMVSPTEDSHFLIVLQIDHSRVAGLLAAHWGNNEFAPPKPFASMVLAAQEHDNGWWDWEVKPTLNPQGYPLDYINSAKFLRGIWLGFYRHGIERVTEIDPYAGYVVSMHGEGLLTQGLGLLPYMPDYLEDSEAQKFIREQKAFRSELLERLRQREEYRELISEENLWINFKLMEVYDQFAQFLCNRYPFNNTQRKNGPTPTLSNTPVPVKPDRPDVTMTVEVRDEKNAVVKPYPFDTDPLAVSFPARLLPQRSYTHEDFLDHFYKAERITITYTLHAPPMT
jgi:Protein of unknown function (DUF3891)